MTLGKVLLCASLLTHLQYFWYQMCGFSTHHTVLGNSSWVSYHSIKFWHYLSGVSADTTRAQSFNGPHFRWQSQIPGCHLYFWPISDKLGFPQPLLGFDNLLEWLTEIRETHLLIYNKEYTEDTNEQIEEEIHRARCMGKGEEFPCSLQAHTFLPAPHVFINLEALWTLYFGYFYGGFII